MLWTIIRDFFVENIFGGTLSSGTLVPVKIGSIMWENGTYNAGASGTDVFVNIGNAYRYDQNIIKGMGISDWLSTTFTIITLILICVFLYLFVKWMFKIFAGLFGH